MAHTMKQTAKTIAARMPSMLRNNAECFTRLADRAARNGNADKARALRSKAQAALDSATRHEKELNA